LKKAASMKKRNSHLTIFVLILLTLSSLTMIQAQTIVIFHTTAGDFKIKLYDETVLHKENFVKLVKQGYYNDVLFHRVIANFMIQAGDPNSRTARPGQTLGDGGPGYTIPAEFFSKYYHKKGALAAARLGDQFNPEKNSSGSQFYIVQGQPLSEGQLTSLVNTNRHVPFTEEQIRVYTTLGGTPQLDNNYTVFGEVTEGLDIIDKIAAVSTDQRNRPIADIKIIKATIAE
jgi:peptidyl-prolyl cis-trans isomerase B (cyclophilin B)